MKLFTPLLFLFLQFWQTSFSQVEPAGQWASTEIEVSYFGEMFLHPGIHLGVNFPYTSLSVAKEKSSKRRGEYFVERKRQWIVGGNLSGYFQTNNHQGYLLNAEYGYRSLKTKSYKPNKLQFWEVDLGLGLYHYELQGRSFEYTGTSFEEIKGRGNAFMPSLSFSWGRSLKISSLRSLFFFKYTTAWEIPFNVGIQQRLIGEVGMIIPLSKNK